MPRGYYVVRWGPHTRITPRKVDGPQEAADACYGTRNMKMKAKFLSSVSRDVGSITRRLELINDTREWTQIKP